MRVRFAQLFLVFTVFGFRNGQRATRAVPVVTRAPASIRGNVFGGAHPCPLISPETGARSSKIFDVDYFFACTPCGKRAKTSRVQTRSRLPVRVPGMAGVDHPLLPHCNPATPDTL
jgi:hypothetical protein